MCVIINNVISNAINLAISRNNNYIFRIYLVIYFSYFFFFFALSLSFITEVTNETIEIFEALKLLQFSIDTRTTINKIVGIIDLSRALCFSFSFHFIFFFFFF